MSQSLHPVPEDVCPHRLAELVARHEGKGGALIPILQDIQEWLGYLPASVLQHLSDRLSIPYSEIAGVVSFYSYFTTVPRGEHTARVCLGTACYVRGGKNLLQALSDHLGVDVGDTTSDGSFTLEVGRCFGACGLAPVLVVDEHVHQQVKPTRAAELLEAYRDGEEEHEM